MRPLFLLCALVMIASAPLATASCHLCLEEVAEDCGALTVQDCKESAVHMAAHMPEYVIEIVRDPEGAVCDLLNDPGCN